MKKLLLVLVGIALISGLMAEVNFYGKVKSGIWYYNMDKGFTGGKSILDMQTNLYSTSNLGAKFSMENFYAKTEIGLKEGNAVYLRLAYMEYDFGSYSLSFGQNYTGFNLANAASQGTSILLGYENMLIGYGVLYDGRTPQLKLSMDNGFYLSLMQPKKIDPVRAGAGAIDALLPKINLGFNYKSDALSIFPTLGINYSKYNKDRAAGIDDAVLAYAFATTAIYHMDAICIKGQVSYGQNINDYGFVSNMAIASKALWNITKSEVANSSTFGGYLQTALKTDIAKFVLGSGFVSNKNDALKDADTAMSIFFQTNFGISKNLCIIPEVGMIDFMEDGNGGDEGSILYFGTKLQASF